MRCSCSGVASFAGSPSLAVTRKSLTASATRWQALVTRAGAKKLYMATPAWTTARTAEPYGFSQKFYQLPAPHKSFINSQSGHTHSLYAGRGATLIPPEAITVGGLPELLHASPKPFADEATSRRLFTLICVLHFKG